MRTAAAAGYTGDQSGYDIDFHAYTELYMVLDALTNIPSRVFLTVPDKAAVPESVQANINSWRDLNPGYDVVVHDDADLEILVQLLMPELHDIWADLLNVQRADIYRFIVVAFFGGELQAV
jgi:mannosyltransferase OCH1-like enzyme